MDFDEIIPTDFEQVGQLIVDGYSYVAKQCEIKNEVFFEWMPSVKVVTRENAISCQRCNWHEMR